ncbi:MAG: hypothetical protein SWY16_25305 [Cyanobacteriota bacterium]|nr:hypothetical protein [Cyanobacteriota bacterium]
MNEENCNIYAAVRALDRLNQQIKILKTDLEKLTREVAQVEDCSQQIGTYLNAAYLNVELYSELFSDREKLP